MTTFEAKENLFRMESLNALFEHATEGIIISDRSGKIVKANPSSEKLFGYNPGELIGKLVEDLVPKRLTNKHQSHRESFNQNPHARSMGKNMDLFGLKKDQSEFPVEISLSYYKSETETFAIAFIIDVTERKTHEANILRLNQNLEKKVEERTQVLQEALLELEKSKEQLSEALSAERELNDMKSRFVTMASHEFRTPLSTILSSISLVSKYNQTTADDKIEKHVQRIKSAVTNMTLILNDFLSAEKLNEGKVFITKQEVDLEKLVTEVCAEMNGILKSGQKIIIQHVGNETAWLDKQITRNMLLNLISNAIKFSPENKNVQVSTKISSQNIAIEVSDNGMGIPEEEQEHLFERFFRAKNATNIQGTGLGLNIVAKYLEALGGEINFKSELEKGTTFFINIPNTGI
jgi:PAS domain S-box-containing protein